MKPKNIKAKQDRIRAIRKQIEEIPAMLEGSLMSKRNRVQRKDGSIHLSPQYYTLQYRGADGRRKWKRIPKKALATVKRLVRAGKRYRALEREYAALITELSLAHSSTKRG